MATGTSNLKSALVSGSTLAAEQVDDLTTLLARADDETIYDLYDLEPPAAATSTFVNTGYIPLHPGALVTEDAFSRLVWIAPARWCRSSTSTTTPRRILSGTVDALSSLALPTIAPAGKWRIELLYAQLTYVDASEPTKGTLVTYFWATSPADANIGSPANVATLPANTSTSWNIPVRYVKNVAAATRTYQSDILSPTPTAAGGLDGRLRRRAGAGTMDAQRSYSSIAQSLATLVAANTITSTITPARVHKGDADTVFRVFKVIAGSTGGTSGATVAIDLDDTRDWRNADFLTLWNVPFDTGWEFGEEPTTVNTAASRQMPSLFTSIANISGALFVQFGQSFEPWGGSGTQAFAAKLVLNDTHGLAQIVGTPYLAAGDHVELVVDMTTGKLQLQRTIAGSSTGVPITVFLFAVFPNSR